MEEIGSVGFNKRRAEGNDKSDRPKKILSLKDRKLNPANTICYVQVFYIFISASEYVYVVMYVLICTSDFVIVIGSCFVDFDFKFSSLLGLSNVLGNCMRFLCHWLTCFGCLAGILFKWVLSHNFRLRPSIQNYT